MKTQEKPISLFESFFSIVSIIFFSEGILALILDPTNQNEGDVKSAFASAAVDNASYRVMAALIYFISLLLIIFKWKKYKKNISGDFFLYLLFIFIIVSILWSDFPLASVKKSGAIIGTSLFGYYLVSRFSLESALKLLNKSFFIMAVLCILSALFFLSMVLQKEYTKALSEEFFRKKM